MVGRVIHSQACVDEGAEWLCSTCPHMKRAIGMTTPLPLRLREDGFDSLLDAIVSQQLSVAAANAIRGRMKAANLTGPHGIREASDGELRGCGLSSQKIRYARALASSGIEYRRLRETPTDKVVEILTEVPGIGRWTAEIYAMFSLGRADVFAPGDLALRESARILFGLDARPTEGSLREMAERWSPWRAVAARALWSYYRLAKGREGVG